MPGKPGQARNEALAERIDYVRHLLARFNTTATIKRKVREQYGETSARTVNEYIARAREAIAADAALTYEEIRRRQLEWYRDMTENAAQDRDKLRAAERFDIVYGLEAPRGLRISGLPAVEAGEGKAIADAATDSGASADSAVDSILDRLAARRGDIAARNGDCSH